MNPHRDKPEQRFSIRALHLPSLIRPMPWPEWGGKNLYLSMLAKFIPSQGQAGQSIQDALAVNDRATAERLAHTLKGVAASVGAVALAESASQLEQAIEAEDAKEYPRLVEATESGLRQAVAAIETYLEEHRQHG